MPCLEGYPLTVQDFFTVPELISSSVHNKSGLPCLCNYSPWRPNFIVSASQFWVIAPSEYSISASSMWSTIYIVPPILQNIKSICISTLNASLMCVIDIFFVGTGSPDWTYTEHISLKRCNYFSDCAKSYSARRHRLVISSGWSCGNLCGLLASFMGLHFPTLVLRRAFTDGMVATLERWFSVPSSVM